LGRLRGQAAPHQRRRSRCKLTWQSKLLTYRPTAISTIDLYFIVLTKRTIGNGALAIGVLLLAVAVAKFLAMQPAREPCNRFCFVYDLLAHFFGVQFANASSGVLWLLLAAVFIHFGIQGRRSNG